MSPQPRTTNYTNTYYCPKTIKQLMLNNDILVVRQYNYTITTCMFWGETFISQYRSSYILQNFSDVLDGVYIYLTVANQTITFFRDIANNNFNGYFTPSNDYSTWGIYYRKPQE